jgi:hypothetical protein
LIGLESTDKFSEEPHFPELSMTLISPRLFGAANAIRYNDLETIPMGTVVVRSQLAA